MERFSVPNWSARNPLGIIALFISLIYGMSALLLGASIEQLSTWNQTILTIFVVIFPFVVLWVFSWLVARHHRKLYGPGDYRSDEGFLNAANTLPPSSLGERLRKEVTLEAERDESETKQGAEPSPAAKPEREMSSVLPAPKINAVETDREHDFLSTYAIESLVFQELQREFGQPIKRDVAVDQPSGNAFHLDGVIDGAEGTILIEVKILRSLSGIKIALQRYPVSYKLKSNELKRLGVKNAKFLLAVVYLGQLENSLPSRWAEEFQRKFHEDILVRFYSSAELLVKYGFSSPQTKKQVGKS